MTLIPINVNATTQEVDDKGNCYINVAAGESATINYDTNNCYVTNYGNLTINGGANIVKLSRYDEYGTINNYGNLTINGGYIEAYSGYGIKHNAGSLTINGGEIYAPLHQVIWAKAGTSTRINGGTFRSAIGGEEAIFTGGSLTICGGTFNVARHYNENAKIDNSSCPVPAKAAAAPVENAAPKAEAPKAEEQPVKQTIVITTTVKSTPKATVTEEQPAETPAKPETSEEPAVEEPAKETVEETVEETTSTEPEAPKKQTLYITPSAKAEGNTQGLIITIVAIAMLGVASAGALFIIRH